MSEKSENEERCFKCGRDLGPKLEWKKMDTDAGPICYACFNKAANNSSDETRKHFSVLEQGRTEPHSSER